MRVWRNVLTYDERSFEMHMTRFVTALCAVLLPALVGWAEKSYRLDDFPSISAAIAACAEKGGGRVVVGRGEHRSDGPVVLRSNVELHLEEGATVVFSDRLEDYLPGVRVAWEGIECVNVSPLVYACGCTNVAITGRGTLKAKMDFWWTWAGARKPDCEVVNRKLKNEWSPKNVPVDERQLWKEPNARFRPQFLHFNRCKDVRLEGFSVRGTPFWTVHVFLCDGVTARNLDVDATGDDGRMINNSDGFDIDATRNVLVEGCTFCQGDDAIVLKSGKDFDGRRLATPTENVVVRNCTVRKGHNLAAIGSELSGGVRNVRISGCRIAGAVGELLHIKTNPRRGGFVENVVIEDVEVEGLKADVLGITSRYYFGGPGEEAFERDFLTPIRNVVLRDIRCRWAARRLNLRGDYLLPVENVSLSNVRIASCKSPDYVASVRNLSVDGLPVSPTIRVLTAADLNGVDVSAAIYQPESRDSVLAFTDGTVKGTVVRASRDLKTWSEPVAELWPEDEFGSAEVKSAKIRNETDGWYMDVDFASGRRTYYTPEVFWPFKPKSCFK